MRSVVLAISLLISLSVLRAQVVPFASRVIEYKPAPGQYINDPLSGIPDAANATLYELSTAVSLGGFGGYIIYGFDHRVMNDPANPYGIDFTIFGNALPAYAEQGIVRVMKDENQNGIPDETWYEIAGSDHYTGGIKRDYSITYYNPGTESASNVPWKDNSGNTGYILSNNFHLQPYYPDHSLFAQIPFDSVTFNGSLLAGRITITKGTFISVPSVFGYADNRPVNSVNVYTVPDNPYTIDIIEGSGGDGIDISWATDSSGNYIDLDGVDFIKIYSGLNSNAGWLGEMSTEIRGIADVAPNTSLQGPTSIILPLNLPGKMTVYSKHNLRSLYFEQGRLIKNKETEWISSDPNLATIIDDSVIHTYKPGNLTLYAKIKNTGNHLFQKQLTISTPVEFRVENIPGFIQQGQIFSISLSLFDNTGDRLEGLYPEISVTGDDVLQIINYEAGILSCKAVKPGIACIGFIFPEFSLLNKCQKFIVNENLNQFEVSVSILKDSICILSRKNYLVDKQDITAFIDRQESGYTASSNYISLADVLISVLLQEKFATAGNEFYFRQDDIGDHKLYLWKLGLNYEYTYGWGGSDLNDAYSRAWVAIINNDIFVNGWDTIQIYPRDIISFRHVDDIRDPWDQVQLIPVKQLSEPGERIGFTVRKILAAKYSNRNFSVSGPFILPDAKILVNKQEVTENNSTLLSDYTGEFSLQFNDGGRYLVGIDHSFSESVEINVNYPLSTRNLNEIPFTIFPNPGTDHIHISINNPGVSFLKIYSLDGKVFNCDIIQGEEWDQVIDISSLPKGSYLLELRRGDKISINKFIKY